MTTLSSLASFALLDTSKLRDGAEFFVNTVRAPYKFRRSVGGDTPLDSQRVAGSGSGLFYRDPTFSHPSWLRQAAFTVDSSAGNDDDPTTVKRWWELHQRIGTGNSSQQATTITVPNGLPAGDPMIVDFGNSDASLATRTSIVGTKGHTGVTGTVGTARRRNVTNANDPNGITPTGGAFNWSPHITTDRMIVGTGGAINGFGAHVALAEGASVGRVSTFINDALTEANITAGDTFEIQTLQRVDSVSLRASRGRVDVRGFVFTQRHEYSSGGGLSFGFFHECSFEKSPNTTTRSTQSYINCRHDGDFVDSGSAQIMTYFGGIFSSLGAASGIQMHSGIILYFQNGVLFQDSRLACSEGCSHVDFVDIGIFGSQPVEVDRDSNLYLRDVWGTLSSAAAFALDRSANVSIESGHSHQTLTGTDPTRIFAIVAPASAVTGDGVSWAQGLAGAYRIDGTAASVSPR